jgi:hypothetical protein
MQHLAAPNTMKKIYLALMLVSLVFSMACGSNGIGGLIGTGHYSNASLTGSYVYQITGYEFSSGSAVQYQEAGIFTADGHGNITGGSDDFAETTSGGVSSTPDTGTYSINSDGTGTVILTFGSSGSVTLSVTLVSNSKLYLIEADNANATGVAESQSSTTLPAGTFIFKQHSVSSIADSSSIGQITLAANGAVTGSDDVNNSGTVNGGHGTAAPLTLAGGSVFNAPDSTGRGTAALIDSTGTVNLVYYIVNASNLRFMVSDAGVIGSGRAEAQSGAPFTTDPLSGNSYAFGSRGDDSIAGNGAVNTVGTISASAGAITGGLFDSTTEGANSFASVAINPSGTYTPVAANGRTLFGFTTAMPSTVQQVFWMVSPARAFFLTLSDSSDVTKIEDGTADQQQGTFTNSSLNGQFAFNMDGYDNNQQLFVDRVGWIQWKGNGNLTWKEVVNNSGQASASGGLSGSYTVGSSGRTTATVSNLSESNNDIVFYLVSGSSGYILENDPGVEINGMMNMQQ